MIAAPVVPEPGVQGLVDVAHPMAEKLERREPLLVGRILQNWNNPWLAGLWLSAAIAAVVLFCPSWQLGIAHATWFA